MSKTQTLNTMISHEHNFIFIHIHRCAGTAVEQFFNNPEHYDHRTPEDYIKQYGKDVYNNYYKFAIVRNPWAKVVSHYFWRKQRAWWYAPGDELDFKTWVKNFDQFKEYLGDKNRPQVEWLTNDEKFIVDDVLRLQDLEQGWQIILNNLGIDSNPLPRVNATTHEHYSHYYDNETREIVQEWYRPDLEAFGFEYRNK